MGRKVFISALGTSFYRKCTYSDEKRGFISTPTRFVQQAALEDIDAVHWNDSDMALFLLTKKARTDNWDKSIIQRENPSTKCIVPYEGLECVLSKLSLPIRVKPLDIPDGMNETEMWQIFNTIFNELQKGDELYFDLTHGFRYLPMLVLVLGHYSKYLKDIIIKHISYGNYEATKDNIAPFVDLTPLASLQEWTSSAYSFTRYGKVKQLADAIKEFNINNNHEIYRLQRSIQDFENDIATCRGQLVYENKAVSSIRKFINNVISGDFPEPFKEIVSCVKQSIEGFKDNEKDGNLKAVVDWCLKYNMIQQAYTLGQESIVTIVSNKMANYNPYPREDRLRVRKFRDYISSLLGADGRILSDESQWNVILSTNRKLTRAFKSLSWIDSLRGEYAKITKGRNQINHAGFIGNVTSDEIIKQVSRPIETCFSIIMGPLDEPILEHDGSLMLINLTNHPSAKWSPTQIDAAQQYGDIIDIAFPPVPSDADEEYIGRLADDYTQKIKTISEGKEAVVHIMGEMTLTMAIISRLKKCGIGCIASTTERTVKELEPGHKEVAFNFVRFRRYE